MWDDKEKWSVREAAYAAMVGIRHYDPREQFHYAAKGIDLEHDVDWRMVVSYLSG